MGVKNMAFKEESPNEGMERLQERSRRMAGHVGGGEGGDVGLSLWAYMIGSLISAQLCPSNATDWLPTNTVLLCRKRDEVFFDGRVHLFR